MTPDASGWRLSANYDHVEKLTASDLAWEWLRRNESYDRDFEMLAANSDEKRGPSLLRAFRQQWGLRFPCRSLERVAGSPGLLASATGYERYRAWRGAIGSLH